MEKITPRRNIIKLGFLLHGTKAKYKLNGERVYAGDFDANKTRHYTYLPWTCFPDFGVDVIFNTTH